MWTRTLKSTAFISATRRTATTTTTMMLPVDPYYQRLSKYSRDVIIAWIEAKGISFFDEELQAIEQRMEDKQKAWIASEIQKLLKERERKSRPAPSEPMAQVKEVAELVKVP
jgi:hypothetical protein